MTSPSSPSASGQPREPEPLEPPFSPTPRRGAAAAHREGGARAPALPPEQPDLPRRDRRAARRVRADLGGDGRARAHDRRERDPVVRRARVAGRGRRRRNRRTIWPWLFYKDGVRELTLVEGFEETEVVKLLEIIQRARKATADDDDLVTMLWEADFAFLKYRVRRSAAGRRRRRAGRRRRGRTPRRPRRTFSAATQRGGRRSRDAAAS